MFWDWQPPEFDCWPHVEDEGSCDKNTPLGITKPSNKHWSIIMKKKQYKFRAQGKEKPPLNFNRTFESIKCYSSIKVYTSSIKRMFLQTALWCIILSKIKHIKNKVINRSLSGKKNSNQFLFQKTSETVSFRNFALALPHWSKVNLLFVQIPCQWASDLTFFFCFATYPPPASPINFKANFCPLLDSPYPLWLSSHY